MSQENTGVENMGILDEAKDNFNKVPIIIRILFVLLVIAFIYDMVTGNPFSIYFAIVLLLFIIAEVYYWFTGKKE